MEFGNKFTIRYQQAIYPDQGLCDKQVLEQRYQAVERVCKGIQPFDRNPRFQNTKVIHPGEHAVYLADEQIPHMEKVSSDVGILAKVYSASGKLTHCGVALQDALDLDLANRFFRELRDCAGDDAEVEIFYAGGTIEDFIKAPLLIVFGNQLARVGTISINDTRRYDVIQRAARIHDIATREDRFNFRKERKIDISGRKFNISSNVDAIWFDENFYPHMSMRVSGVEIKTRS